MFILLSIAAILIALILVKPHGPQTSVYSMFSADREDLRSATDRPVLR